MNENWHFSHGVSKNKYSDEEFYHKDALLEIAIQYTNIL